MLPDYVILYSIILNLVASVTQRNLYLIDAKLFDHVYGVSVPSDHLTLRVRIASSAAAFSTSSFDLAGFLAGLLSTQHSSV